MQDICRKDESAGTYKNIRFLLCSGFLIFGFSVHAAVNLSIDQGSAIPNGMRLCDASGNYCVDITSTEPPSDEGVTFIPGTPILGSAAAQGLFNTELVELVYDTSNSPIPFNLEVLNVSDINSLTTQNNPGIRDAYAWSQTGTWQRNGFPQGAIVSVDGSADAVGNFVLTDPDGNNNLANIGQFTILPPGTSDVLLNMAGAANGHNLTFTLDVPTTSVSLYVFNSGGGEMFWNFVPSMIVTLPDTTLFKNVINDDGGSALANAWTLEANAGGGTAEVSGSDGVQGQGLTPGSYVLSESGGPSQYELTDLSCSNANPGGTDVSGTSLANPNFVLAVGDAISCTFTNDDIGTDLEVVKSFLPANPEVGQTVTFSLEVTNNGPDPATAVVIDDSLLAGFTFVSGSMTGGDNQNQSAPNLQWEINNLAVGTGNTVTLTYQANVVAP